VTPVRKRTCDVTGKRHFLAKVSYKNFSCWFERNQIRLRRFQTAFLSTVSCCRNRHESTS